jgi:hypothetical protein
MLRSLEKISKLIRSLQKISKLLRSLEKISVRATGQLERCASTGARSVSAIARGAMARRLKRVDSSTKARRLTRIS